MERTFIENTGNEIGLVLQGGGALGAYEWGALERLYKEEWFRPTVISGVSIGAITAATIAAPRCGDPVEALNELWEKLTIKCPEILPRAIQSRLSAFGNPNFYRPRIDYFQIPSWTHYYDTAPILALLESLVDFDEINSDQGPQLVLAATDVVSGEIVVFSNRGDNKTTITPKHVLASGSLPPGFPMTEIDGRYFWDGGLFSNTPLSPVIEALDPSDAVEKTLIVINLFPSLGKLPENMQEVSDRMLQIIFDNKIAKNYQNTKRIREFVEMIKSVEAVIPDELKELPAWKNLACYKVIQNMLYITNNRSAVGDGAADFSRTTLENRRACGFADAGAAVAEKARLDAEHNATRRAIEEALAKAKTKAAA